MCFFFFKQKTAYEMRISDWSSDVCSSDLCTKAAIEELTRSQALDVAKDNIRVNAVIPGWTWSAPIKKAHAENPEWVEQLAAQFHMSGRIGSAEELARAVLVLLSSASSIITRSILTVDVGHLTLGPPGTLAP